MVRVVRQKFNIDEHDVPIFETCSLEVCNDENVEIDEDAYSPLASYLNEIEVCVSVPTKVAGLRKPAEKQREREEERPVAQSEVGSEMEAEEVGEAGEHSSTRCSLFCVCSPGYYVYRCDDSR